MVIIVFVYICRSHATFPSNTLQAIPYRGPEATRNSHHFLTPARLGKEASSQPMASFDFITARCRACLIRELGYYDSFHHLICMNLLYLVKILLKTLLKALA